jgi:hypothetical protein
MTNQQLLERAMDLAIRAKTDSEYKRAVRLINEISSQMYDSQRAVQDALQATRNKVRNSWKQ